MVSFFSMLIRLFVFCVVALQSQVKKLKTWPSKVRVIYQCEFRTEKMLLLALYQNGTLRPDIVRMLKSAREQGIYVIAVNTLKLNQPSQYSSLIDCYIERPNFGRDFGSYKTGFLHIYANNWEAQISRLMIANDSVFYTKHRTAKFLRDMFNSEIEVLGSTENFDREHHLGSFCIAISNKIIRHKKLKYYWHKYKLTDLRPSVITRGEFMLSRTLRQCVSSADEFHALYSGARYFRELRNNNDLLEFSLKNVRKSKINPWKRASIKNVAVELIKRNFLNLEELKSGETKKTYFRAEQSASTNVNNSEYYFITTIAELLDFVKAINDNVEAPSINEKELSKIIVSELADGFNTGSHIHQNAIILLKQGLPLVKNDCIYRGLINIEDLYNLTNLLEPDEAIELETLLLSRPYGGHHLEGMEKLAFNYGYL